MIYTEYDSTKINQDITPGSVFWLVDHEKTSAFKIIIDDVRISVRDGKLFLKCTFGKNIDRVYTPRNLFKTKIDAIREIEKNII